MTDNEASHIRETSSSETPTGVVARYLRQTRSMLLASATQVENFTGDSSPGVQAENYLTAHFPAHTNNITAETDSSNERASRCSTGQPKLLTLLEKVDLDTELYFPNWESNQLDSEATDATRSKLRAFEHSENDDLPSTTHDAMNPSTDRASATGSPLSNSDAFGPPLGEDRSRRPNAYGYLHPNASDKEQHPIALASAEANGSLYRLPGQPITSSALTVTTARALSSHLVSHEPLPAQLFLDRIMKAVRYLRSARLRVR